MPPAIRVAAPMIMKVVPLEPVSASCEVVLPCWTCALLSVLALLPQSTLSPVRVQVLSLPPEVADPEDPEPLVERAGTAPAYR